MTDSFLDFIKLLKEYGILDLIGIIIPIISFLILFFTLRHDKKQFTVQLYRSY